MDEEEMGKVRESKRKSNKTKDTIKDILVVLTGFCVISILYIPTGLLLLLLPECSYIASICGILTTFILYLFVLAALNCHYEVKT